jgi:ketosteroid isomerase-like protein
VLAYALTLAISAADGGHEVLALLERQSGAWSRGDLDAFCSVYADDAVFLSPRSLPAFGHAAARA